MKKITLSPKAKKSILLGTLILCAGAATIALLHSHSASIPADAASSSAANSSSAVSVDPQPITGDQAGTKANFSSGAATGSGAFIPAKGNNGSEALTTASRPSSAPPKPVIQGDSKNDGTAPTNPALTNQNKKPAYVTPPKAPSNNSTPQKTDNSQTKKPSNSNPKPSGGNTPTGGSHAGQVYVDGFGWVTPGSGQGTTVGNPGDELTGHKVGTMD